MTRHIIHISLVILLGVVTSVAVAWGCALYVPVDTDELFDSDSSSRVSWDDLWSKHNTAASIVPIRHESMSANAFGRECTFVYYLITPSDPVQCGLCRAGWPMYALSGYVWESSVGERTYVGAIHAPRQPDDMFAFIFQVPFVPIDPIYTGLLANTAIYGGVWWAMLFGPGMFIRWRRRCAGRCVKCGYDLRGAVVGDQSSVIGVVCPECGEGP